MDIFFTCRTVEGWETANTMKAIWNGKEISLAQFRVQPNRDCFTFAVKMATLLQTIGAYNDGSVVRGICPNNSLFGETW